MPMHSLLDIENLQAGFGRAIVLRGISFSVAAAARVAVVGPNGAGKTTLLRTISGLVRPRGGAIRSADATLTGAAPERIVRAGIVHVPEGRQVFPGLTVAENLWLGGFTAPARRAQLREQVLEIFPRLRERLGQAADSLSGGEQQMLAIGRGLMAAPRLLMLDEPTLGLAPVMVDQVMQALAELVRQTGIALLVVEQNIQLTSEICDTVHVMVNGRIAASGAVSDMAGRDMIRLYMGGDSQPTGTEMPAF